MLRVRQHIVGAVDRELGPKGVHGQIHVCPLVQGRGPPRGLLLGRDFVVGLHRGGDQKSEHEECKDGTDANPKLHPASRLVESFLVFEGNRHHVGKELSLEHLIRHDGWT